MRDTHTHTHSDTHHRGKDSEQDWREWQEKERKENGGKEDKSVDDNR